jgi:hypothetical protein
MPGTRPTLALGARRENYVQGWRAFLRDRGRLRSWSLPEHVWDGPVMTARCFESRLQGYYAGTGDLSKAAPFHRSPDEQCTCGIYAVKDPHQVTESGMLVPSSRAALARVRGWGKTIVGRAGYRFEHAQIVRLWLLDAPERERADAERQYGLRYHCPVETVAPGDPVSE